MLEGVREGGELERRVGLRLEEDAPVERPESHGGVLEPRRARVAGVQPPGQQDLVLRGLDPVLLIDGGEFAAAG